ncbi:MAG: helix-turn-helix domain-containing protein [Bacteroidales bacterium]|nr:helix-turn-helix domain-containing protein [Bacteroidales bacterium]
MKNNYKRYLLRFLTVVTLLCLMILTQAQTLTIQPLPTQQQLPMSSIHSIMQDTEGYMWYATEGGGLCRDNGYQIHVFRPTDSNRLQEACKVHCLCETANGNILFGTSDWLYMIDKKDYAVRRLILSPACDQIDALFSDSQGNVWVGTKGMIYRLDRRGKQQEKHPSQVNDSKVSVASFFEDSQGTLYATQWGDGGILRMQRGEKGFTALQWPMSCVPLFMVEDLPNHCFWLATSGEGVVKMEIKGNACQITLQPETKGSHDRNHTLHILRDSTYGLFWVTTLDNLYAYHLGADGLLHEFSLDGILPDGHKILDQICESRDGNIYVAGYTPHTFVITPAQSDIHRLAIPSMRQRIGFPVLADCAVYDGTRYIWLWQGRQGLMLYDKETENLTAAPKKFDRTLQPNHSQGGIWASEGHTVLHLWQEAGEIRQETIAQTPDSQAVRLLQESPTQTLYIATHNHLFRLPLIGRNISQLATFPSTPTDMTIDHKGNLYITLGAEGLYRITPKGDVQHIEVPAEQFLSVSTADNGTVWLSTFEGNVYCYTPSRNLLEHIALLSSPDAAAIRTIRTDGLGHVWTLSDQRVMEYAPLNHAFRIIRTSDSFIDVSYFYTLAPLTPTLFCIAAAGALIEVESSGTLNQKGTSLVHPRLSSYLVGGQLHYVNQETSTLQLEADEDNITLQLTTLASALNAGNVCFAYQLDGDGDDWLYLPNGTNTVILNSLSRGTHRLQVMATDRYGCWSEPVEVAVICRAAHWYQTWWAYLLYIVLFVLIAIGLWHLERRIQLLRRLIQRRHEVRLDEIELRRDEVDATWRDDELLRKAVAKIEENLSNSDYNVQRLSDDLCMSRITLYRRLQQITGVSPADFIRDIRLKKAAQLLTQSPEATVADIARKIGFASPKHLSRCFRAKFGVSPTEYRTTAPTAKS